MKMLGLFVACTLLCFALSPVTQAVLPPPDGGYSGYNTAEGEDALFSLTTGQYNTAIGFAALYSGTIASFNTALGTAALLYNTGDENTAVGAGALVFNTTGRANTGIGAFALSENRSGFANTAVGDHALESNESGISNVALGALAMQANTSSLYSVAVGVGALMANQTTGNTGVGHLALSSNTTGGNNTALGYQAGSALTTGDNNIDINNEGVAGESGTIRIGASGSQTRAFIAGIRGVAVAGTAVVVGATGQLGVAPSSQLFKEEIKPMDKASETILALSPVAFRYKKEVDPNRTPQFGLVAEEVEKVNPDLVAHDAQGKPYTVRYDQVNAMLLNEFLKEHSRVESLEKAMAERQKENAAMRAMLEEQAALIQKMSVQVELSKPAPQTVLNNQ